MIDELHTIDGKPFAFAHGSAKFIAPHESGSGTLLVLGDAPNPRELHVAEDYETVHRLATEGRSAAAMRRALDDLNLGSPAGLNAPF